MSSALATAGTQQGASNVLDTSAAAHGGALGIGGAGQRADAGRAAGLADLHGPAGEQRPVGGEAAGMPVAGGIESGPLGETGVQRTVALSKGWAAFPQIGRAHV